MTGVYKVIASFQDASGRPLVGAEFTVGHAHVTTVVP